MVSANVRNMTVEIGDAQQTRKETRKAAQLLVYSALAMHPALEYMRPPTGVLADADWFTDLRSPLNQGIFRRLAQNEHFKRTSMLGATGTRARIMMLLLWVLGHRLPEDQIGKLLSTAIGDALPKDADELQQLSSVQRVLRDLCKMIKTKLPLPPDRNPFLGKNYRVEDEKKMLSRSELWAYNLPANEQYEYDALGNSSMLLRRVNSRIIIPQNKITLHLVNWVTSSFGLGKKVYSRDDIDPNAYWNADPPFIDDADPAFIDDSESLSTQPSEFAFEGFDGVDNPPYDFPFQDLPPYEFLHIRYCHTYKVHGWVHNWLARILLFNSFCATQQLPSPVDVGAAVHVSRWLPSKLGHDIAKYLELFIIEGALLVWGDVHEGSAWKPDFGEWSVEGRGMTAIFYDAIQFNDRQVDYDYPQSHISTMRHFLIDPLSYCPHITDILSLPLIQSQAADHALPSNNLPRFDPSACICGNCALIEQQVSADLDAFGHQYFIIVEEASSRGCNALKTTWEPVLRAAEEWQEDLLRRIASDFAAFPWTYDRRAGPAILGIANKMKMAVGSHLTVEKLIRFAVALRLTRLDGDGYIFRTAPIMRPLPPTGLGYILTVPFAEDREEYRVKDYEIERIICAGGCWLEDLAGSDITDDDGGIAFLYPTDQISIEYHTLNPGAANALCMPLFAPDFPDRLPSPHTPDNGAVVGADPTSNPDELTFNQSIITSNLKSDGFPLLSVADRNFPSTRGASATLIKLTLSTGPVVETVWKPIIKLGSQCEHSDNYNRMIYHSPTSAELLLKIQLPDDQLDEKLVSHRWDWDFLSANEYADRKCRDALRERLDEYQRRTVRLRERGSPLERNRACIVRCEGDDGPAEPIAILAASLGKKVYIMHYKECWACGLAGMQAQGCTVGIAKNTRYSKS